MGGPNVKNTMVDRLLGIVAPHLCSGCGKIGSLLCDNCKYNITSQTFSGCILCNRTSIEGICQHHKVAFQQIWVVGERSGTLQRLIGGFKFQNMKTAAHDLADLLDKRLPRLPFDTQVVPVPTTPAHIRERGYDHLGLIASGFAVRRGLTLNPLLGRKNMATQHYANRQDRVNQAKSAFLLTGQVNPTLPYLIIDDVVTTGSTILEASRLLASAGAQYVSVGVLARQPLEINKI
ncbi:MAG: phosphoribosyltransferase family protein [Candidatus Microsaccharimonas sp.]